MMIRRADRRDIARIMEIRADVRGNRLRDPSRVDFITSSARAELVISLKTAKAIGFEFARDEVIE
jgi:hypothetical protein